MTIISHVQGRKVWKPASSVINSKIFYAETKRNAWREGFFKVGNETKERPKGPEPAKSGAKAARMVAGRRGRGKRGRTSRASMSALGEQKSGVCWGGWFQPLGGRSFSSNRGLWAIEEEDVPETGGEAARDAENAKNEAARARAFLYLKRHERCQHV